MATSKAKAGVGVSDQVHIPFSDSVSKTFRRRRLELGLKLPVVAAETKIQKRYLVAMEGGYVGFPHTVQSVGLIKRYAKLLKLSQSTAAAKYLAERGPVPQVLRRIHRQPLRTKSIVGSRLIIWLGALGVLVLVAGYLFWQIVLLAAPPPLHLDSPTENQLVKTTSVEVRGETAAGAEVSVNGQAAYVDNAGRFQLELSLSPGLNSISVEAKSSRGKTATLNRTVLVH